MKAILRTSGGLPNVPRGENVVEPINLHGRMPRPERTTRPALWQVHVRDRRFGKVIPVGPRMGKEFAEMFMLTIGEQIALGAEKRWEHPHLVMHLPRSD